MTTKYTLEELNTMSPDVKDLLIISMQEQIERLNNNLEKLIEQVRLADQYRFGRHTEKLSQIEGQMSMFDEAEVTYDENNKEPEIEEVVITTPRKPKEKGKRDKDLEGFETEPHLHDITKEQLDEFYGEGNWKSMPDEEYKRLKYQPASWKVEVHTVKVYVGTGGDHQDEFIRGDRPKDLLRNSIATPSLVAAIFNGKFVNSMPYDRMEKEFKRNGVNVTRQNMADWTIRISNKYLASFCDRMKYHLLLYHVTQSDETPCQVIKDGRSPTSRSYMWVHRSGELYRDKSIVLYEYQKGRDHHIPLEYYKDYSGVLVTDGLSQYHLVDKKLSDVQNSNCWAHTRRDYYDAIKVAGNKSPEAIKQSVAYQALARIGTIYKIENGLRDLTPDERLKERQANIKPLVDEYFEWVKLQLSTTLPKGKTAEGLNYSVNQEQYLRVFLEDGEVPIDNSACLSEGITYPNFFPGSPSDSGFPRKMCA